MVRSQTPLLAEGQRGTVSPSLPRTGFRPKVRPLLRAGKDSACLTHTGVTKDEQGDALGTPVLWEVAFGRPSHLSAAPRAARREGPGGVPEHPFVSLGVPWGKAEGHSRGYLRPRCPSAVLQVEATSVTASLVRFVRERELPLPLGSLAGL